MNSLTISDLHEGSEFGLTPPRWWRNDLRVYQEPFWSWFVARVEKYAPYDFVVVNGDAVHGEGRKERVDLLVPDTGEQAEMAATVINQIPLVPGGRRYMTWGTSFHVVGTYEYEKAVAEKVGAQIADTIRLRFNGANVNWRHVCGRSDIPYGQPTQIYKEAVRDILQAEEREYESADYLIRSHVHYSVKVSITKTAATTPALELPESVFSRGLRTQYYHVGFLRITDEGEEPGELRIQRIKMPLQSIEKVEYECLDK